MAEIRLIWGLFLGLFLSVEFAGFSDVVGHGAVQATVDEDVILPCHLEPPFDVITLTVEWTWNGRIVHLYRHREDNRDFQDEQFRDRTFMFPDEMKDGNISLKLTNVTEKDSGLYSCYVPRLESQVKRGNVRLTVNPQKDPGERGGDKTTPEDQKQSGVQTEAIVGIAVSAGIVLIVLVLLVLGCAHKDRLETWRNGRRRTERNNHRNHQLTERGNPAEMNPQGPDPDQNPQGADAQ